MKYIQRVLRSIDRAQQSRTAPAVVFAVVKKYGDDSAGNIASLLAFSGFITLFPLLLLLVTVLGLVLSSDTHIRNEILRSTFGQFPLMGTELRVNVHALHRNSLIGLVVAVHASFLRLFRTGRKRHLRDGKDLEPSRRRACQFPKRMGRSAEFILLLGAGLAVTTCLTGLATNTASRPLLVDAGAIWARLSSCAGSSSLATGC